jgi:hypothetical protein
VDNRQKRRQHLQPPKVGQQVTSPLAPKASWFKEHWEGVVALLGLAIALIGLVVSILSAAFTSQQAQIANKTYDRQSGRIQADLKLTDFYPKQGEAPARFRKRLPGAGADDPPVLLFEDLEALQSAGFMITAKNMGAEPIDAVRIEVETVWDRRGDQAVQNAKVFETEDIGLKRVSSVEHVLSAKLFQNDTVAVSVTRPLLEQMMEVQPPHYPGDLAFGWFQVSVFGKLVGASTFDASPDRQYVRWRYYWKISAFDRDRCRKLASEMQANPVINYDAGKAREQFRKLK